MPIITIDIGKLTKAQKAEMVCKFTQTAHEISGIDKSAFVVIIRENDPENIGSGGELLCDKMKK